MSSENKIYTLEEITTLITDGKHGDCQDLAGSGYYFLSVKDVKGDRLNYEQARQITQKDFEETHRRTNLEPGDILFTNTGTIGRMAIASANELTRRTTFQKSVAILKPKINLVISRYLFYLLKAENRRLSALAEGTTQKNLLLKDFRSFEIGELPPVKNQKAIAHILGTLDDKIELNRKTNETLEAMAKALFKSWFVDFDAVRAKAEGRPTGLPDEISDLFPDSFEDSELGEIPSGWEVQELGEISTISGGKQLEAGKLMSKGRFHVYGANGVMGFHEQTTHDSFVIIFGRVGAYCGSVKWEYGGAWVNNNASSVIPLKNKELVLQSMLEADFSNYRTGSAQPFIPNGVLASSPVLMPTDAVATLFCDSVKSIRLNQKQNESIVLSLVEIRDALLPKLISGEIRIPDAEKMLEEVGV